MFTVLLGGCCVMPLLGLPVRKQWNPYLVRARNELSHFIGPSSDLWSPRKCFLAGFPVARSPGTTPLTGLLVLVCVVCCCCNELMQTTHVLSYSYEDQDTTQARLAGCHTLELEYFSKVNWLKTYSGTSLRGGTSWVEVKYLGMYPSETLAPFLCVFQML